MFVVTGKEYTSLRAKWIYTNANVTEDDFINELKVNP